jgi:asparagine synthase (glutamine-hydrolysing)
VDSSAVVAAMAKLSSTPVKTFSIGFREQDFDELAYAEEVARVCGTDHHPQIVTGDVQSILPGMVRLYGEPFADPSAIPSFYVCEAARANVTVALNGDGGDELLGGYPRYGVSSLSLVSGRIFGRLFPAESLINVAANPSGGPEFVARSLSRLVRDFLRPELGSLMNYRNNWHDGTRRGLLGRDSTGRVVPEWRREWFARASANSSNPVDWMLYFDNHTQLPNDLLVKMDIASMHCGLEARSPLLDHELAEFCAGLPLALKVRNGSGKYLLKRLASKSFGEAFVNRPKQGFGIPLNLWLQGPLRSMLVEVLSDHTLMEPFDDAVVSRTVREFLSGRSRPDHTERLWGLLMYGLWRDHTRADGAPLAVSTESPADARLAAAH